jgi:hypothetical protein
LVVVSADTLEIKLQERLKKKEMDRRTESKKGHVKGRKEEGKGEAETSLFPSRTAGVDNILRHPLLCRRTRDRETTTGNTRHQGHHPP